MSLRIGIVADDFTSAMDGAGPFVAYGAAERAVAIVGGRDGVPHVDLVAIDTDTRSRRAAEAAGLVRAAILQVRDAPLLVKTVDSTLRGHLALEIEAALAASGRRRVIFAPAFPAAGRTTRGGVQLLDGGDLARSSFARDARHAVTTGAIAQLLAPLPADRVEICDATTDADLDAIVAAAAGDTADVLWVGSPGLAHALARRHARADATARPPLPPARRIAVIVGSLHPVNRDQLERLMSVHDGSVAVVTAPPVGARAVTPAAAAAVAADLARQARALLAAGYDGLIVTGGETVRAVVAGLDDASVEVVDEPQPGIVRGRIAGGTATLVTKAGGFGDADTLVELHAHLTSLRG